MINKTELVDILRRGADIWNRYREDNPSLEIDLSGSNLTGLQLSDANLSAIDFSGCDLSKCLLENVNFKGCTFVNAKICFAKISRSDISYCSFNNGDLYNLCCNECKFTGSEFIEANMSSIRLENCLIDQCDFRKATTTGMVLDSRVDLKNVIHFLSDMQLSGIIFNDELDLEDDTLFKAELNDSPSLQIKIDSGKLTPFNLSYFLLAIEGVYNNLLYLSQTDSTDIEEIKRNITPYYQGVGANESLLIKRVSEGSVVVELTTIAASAAGILFTLSKTVDIVGKQILEYKKLQLEAAMNDASVKKIEAETDKLVIENSKSLIEIDTRKHVATNDAVDCEVDYSSIVKSLVVESKTVSSNKQQLFEAGVMPLENILNKYEKMGIKVVAQVNG